MLEVKNLSVHYGMIQAVRNVDFQVNEGGNRVSNWGKRCRKVNHLEDFIRTHPSFRRRNRLLR